MLLHRHSHTWLPCYLSGQCPERRFLSNGSLGEKWVETWVCKQTPHTSKQGRTHKIEVHQRFKLLHFPALTPIPISCHQCTSWLWRPVRSILESPLAGDLQLLCQWCLPLKEQQSLLGVPACYSCRYKTRKVYTTLSGRAVVTHPLSHKYYLPQSFIQFDYI